jgi:hypothetical protein
MKRLFCFLIFLHVAGNSLAQQCKVMPDSLRGTYTGSCKEGFANGRGVATGIDIYTGQFKNGFPDGTGKYVWKNGSWYDGVWKMGVYEGKGMLHLIGSDKSVREFAGFWSGGIYLGSESKPFLINLMTNKISEVNISKSHGSAMGDIIITVYDIINSASTINSTNHSFISKQKLTDIQVKEGSFTNMVTDVESSHYNNIYKLYGVVFPIHLLLYFDQEEVDLEIFQTGKWDVFVKLEKMSQDGIPQ